MHKDVLNVPKRFVWVSVHSQICSSSFFVGGFRSSSFLSYPAKDLISSIPSVQVSGISSALKWTGFFPQNVCTWAGLHRQSLPIANTEFPGLGPREVLFHRLVLPLPLKQINQPKPTLRMSWKFAECSLCRKQTPENWGDGGKLNIIPKRQQTTAIYKVSHSLI